MRMLPQWSTSPSIGAGVLRRDGQLGNLRRVCIVVAAGFDHAHVFAPGRHSP
jgi:hypothetical protein